MIALAETRDTLSLPRILRFEPEHSKVFLDDDGSGEVLVYFGYLDCPGCHHRIEVSAESGPMPTIDYCPGPRCGTRIVVGVEAHYLRPDDSLTGCICGDEDCEYWSELDAVEEAV